MVNLNEVTSKLKEYKEMVDAGLLTQQEFDELKAKLLSETTQNNSSQQANVSTGNTSSMNVEAITQAVTAVPNATGKVGDKSKLAAALLGIFLGGFGVHNFYLGFREKGKIQLIGMLISIVLMLIVIGSLTATILGIWGFVEGILILVSKPGTKWHRDALGNELQD